MRGDRIAAVLLGVVACGYLFAARSFETGFLADPIGPKAFPNAIGILGLFTSVLLWFFASSATSTRLDPPARLRALVLGASLAVYALLLEPVGFLVTTTLEMTLLVVLFRGRLVLGLLGGLAVSLGFFLVFAYGLSVPLPLGSWLTSWGGP